MAILGFAADCHNITWPAAARPLEALVSVLQPFDSHLHCLLATSTMGRFLTSTALALLAAAGVQAADESGMWGQCGGNNWTGPKKCVAGAVCTYQNDWYCQ